MNEEYIGWLDDEWNTVLDQSQPIVRCSDCKHYERDEIGECCTLLDFVTMGMACKFCAWGERTDNRTTELLPCPFCGGEAKVNTLKWVGGYTATALCKNEPNAHYIDTWDEDEAKAVERITKAWNRRAALEFDNWFYLPKPKEPIVEVTETTPVWDGTKVTTDLFYQVQEQAVRNWARELDEHIIERICEVFKPERTCKQEERGWGTEGDHARVWLTCGHDCMVPTVQDLPNYCPRCGARVTGAGE